jgi:hypothetical protein
MMPHNTAGSGLDGTGLLTMNSATTLMTSHNTAGCHLVEYGHSAAVGLAGMGSAARGWDADG